MGFALLGLLDGDAEQLKISVEGDQQR